jgi:hypothetical protein
LLAGATMNNKIKVKFTEEQQDYLCEVIGEWYLKWKGKITPNHQPHSLGIAKEELKAMICGYYHNDFLEKMLDITDDGEQQD